MGSLITWASIALVVVVVVVMVVVSQTDKSTSAPSASYTPEPVPTSILREVTQIPASSYDAVGTGGAVTPPSVVGSQPPLIFTGRPGVFVLDGEFCPFCAAERWAVVASLSRFGTVAGLRTMESSPSDVHPRTQTFEFATATYTSPYVVAKLLEMYGQEGPTGGRPIIREPTEVERALMKKYDAQSSVPFFDVGNEVIYSGSSFTPGALSGLSRARIAADLSNPASPVTKLILGASNYLSAAICAVDGERPGAVCSSSGVQAAAAVLKLRR